MGKQSSRPIFDGRDHKEIFYRGNYHDKMYIGNQLVWEKNNGIGIVPIKANFQKIDLANYEWSDTAHQGIRIIVCECNNNSGFLLGFWNQSGLGTLASYKNGKILKSSESISNYHLLWYYDRDVSTSYPINNNWGYTNDGYFWYMTEKTDGHVPANPDTKAGIIIHIFDLELNEKKIFVGGKGYCLIDEDFTECILYKGMQIYTIQMHTGRGKDHWVRNSFFSNEECIYNITEDKIKSISTEDYESYYRKMYPRRTHGRTHGSYNGLQYLCSALNIRDGVYYFCDNHEKKIYKYDLSNEFTETEVCAYDYDLKIPMSSGKYRTFSYENKAMQTQWRYIFIGFTPIVSERGHAYKCVFFDTIKEKIIEDVDFLSFHYNTSDICATVRAIKMENEKYLALQYADAESGKISFVSLLHSQKTTYANFNLIEEPELCTRSCVDEDTLLLSGSTQQEYLAVYIGDNKFLLLQGWLESENLCYCKSAYIVEIEVR